MKDKKDYLFEDFPEFKVTEETKKMLLKIHKSILGVMLELEWVNFILMKNINKEEKKY